MFAKFISRRQVAASFKEILTASFLFQLKVLNMPEGSKYVPLKDVSFSHFLFPTMKKAEGDSFVLCLHCLHRYVH